MHGASAWTSAGSSDSDIWCHGYAEQSQRAGNRQHGHTTGADTPQAKLALQNTPEQTAVGRIPVELHTLSQIGLLGHMLRKDLIAAGGWHHNPRFGKDDLDKPFSFEFAAHLVLNKAQRLGDDDFSWIGLVAVTDLDPHRDRDGGSFFLDQVWPPGCPKAFSFVQGWTGANDRAVNATISGRDGRGA